MASAFDGCCLDLLARLWLELERLATDSGTDGAVAGRGRIALGTEIVLLELAVLDAAGDRWRAMRLVTAAERQRLRDLIVALNGLVARIVDASDAARPDAVALAQNRLYNELRARAVPLAQDAPRAG